MRAPILEGLIVAVAAVGLAALFAKGPPSQAQPNPQNATLVTAAMPQATPAGGATTAPFPAWIVPDPDVLPDDDFGRTVRYGRDLIAHTSATIGPGAADPSMRYSGNGLECQSCHLDAGTRRFGIPLAGLWAIFPTFIARENEVRTLEQRINGCMERSMNGRTLPEGGPEMGAILAYIRYISEGATTGQPPTGRGTPALPLPNEPADLQHGAEVYQAQCATCHKPDGQGKRLEPEDANAQRRLFEFPPLWGPDSYNDGAGMARSVTAARFIRANMPFSADFEHPQLNPHDAFDVAAFVNSHPRPHKEGTETDYPNRRLKPADAAYPPFADPFPAEQHRIGPWPPIERWLRGGGVAHSEDGGQPASLSGGRRP